MRVLAWVFARFFRPAKTWISAKLKFGLLITVISYQ
jgi:hypothetical protein